MRSAVFIFLLFSTLASFSQKKTAFLSGKIIDENKDPVSVVTITILEKQKGFQSSDSGKFEMEVPAGKAFALVFTHTGFHEVQKKFYFSPGEKEQLTVRLIRNSKMLENVLIKSEKERQETGLIKINPKSAITVP